MRRLRWGLLLLALGAAAAVAAACSESTAPLGKGNVIVVDVDASGGQQEQQDEGGVDDVFARVDDSGYAPSPDGYDPFGLCTMCGCPSGTYCFGGGTGFTTFDGNCHADGGAPTDGGLALGCLPIPAECPDAACDCILMNLPKMTCVPQCTAMPQSVYCSNP